jgi:hypothetical protein
MEALRGSRIRVILCYLMFEDKIRFIEKGREEARSKKPPEGGFGYG